MALFQKSVLNQYLKQLDKDKVANAYTLFKSHFHNTTIQQQIRDSKEEQYQEGFFRDLFVDVLGYVLNPQPNFNLITEQKNEINSKKADGAILKDNEVLAVIELKGTNTSDLNTVTQQAFGYKNNQKKCKYVLISNFEKLRFYIDNAIDYEEFDLFTISEEQFRLLYLCVHADNLLSNLPDKIKQASTVKEENVTKQLYKDYSEFKGKLFADTLSQNPKYDKLVLFKKSQKLLDRILFILFAEDRGLLNANTIQTILDEYENLKKLDAYTPLYERFKKHFTYLNEGFKNEKYEVFGYNGGLFAPDEILDSILISDNILLNYTPTLAKYDYDTEIDVNILGHIFEHSLNDIEEIQAELEGKEIDKTKTKRKKDGVFYTPKYITKYIVENTIGALCSEKRNEFGIIEENYTPDKRKSRKKELLETLDNYQSWLLQITIVDPACGSGAFLNQALDFLILEHKIIDELRAQLLGHSFVLPDHEIEILENNIFGVDLNEESVEIARLSLWLRTARKGRKLNSLNNNIKCGNSLIDDATIAGDKAFNWQKEFPQIFRPKEKEAYHVVLTTHNSRTSQRMINYGVKKGAPVELNLQEEIELTRIISNIILQDKLNCLAYNICKDHVHLIIVCELDELTKIIQKIKSISSKEFHRLDIPMGHDPLEHGNHLWSQKFFRANLDVWELNTVCKTPGLIYKSTYLQNAIEYIKNNRTKHQLPQSDELDNIIKNFCVDEDIAFKPEHKGGFDVVIGNPPYGAEFDEMSKKYITQNFKTYKYRFESYVYFIEKGINIINSKGNIGFIVPELWLGLENCEPLRLYINKNSFLYEINIIGENVFIDAVVNTAMVFISKSKRLDSFIVHNKNNSWNIKYLEWQNTTQLVIQYRIQPLAHKIIKKIELNSFGLSAFGNTIQGITPYDKYRGQSPELIKNRGFHFKIQNDNTCGKWYNGEDLNRYTINWSGEWLSYGNWLAAPREPKFFEGNRIIFREIPGKNRRIQATIISDKGYYGHSITPFILEDKQNERLLKSILCIVNSKLISWYGQLVLPNFGKEIFPKLNPQDIRQLPISKNIHNCNELDRLSEIMLAKNKELQTIKSNFIKLLQARYSNITINTKLGNWNELSFKDFYSELLKCSKKHPRQHPRQHAALENIHKQAAHAALKNTSEQAAHAALENISISEQAELLQYFEAEQTKANIIQQTITQTDKEIDAMVYKLYELSDEEIKIIEQ